MASEKYTIDISELKCAMCLESWIDKDPRVLNCQHTFCLQCLQGMNPEYKITCPICRKRMKIFGDINNIPKSIIKGVIEKVSSCSQHGKIVIQPKIVCKTCKIKDLCQDCLEKDHSSPSCQIISDESLKKSCNKFRETYNNLLKRQKKKYKKILERTIIDLEERSEQILELTRSKIISFYKRRENIFNENNIENLFMNEDELKVYFEKLSEQRLYFRPIGNSLEIPSPCLSFNRNYIDFDINITDIKEYCDLNIENKRVTMNDNGIFILKNSYTLLYRSFSNSNQKKFFLDEKLYDIAALNGYVYGLNESCTKLLRSNLNIIDICDIEFKTFYQTKNPKNGLIRANENDLKYRYVLLIKQYDINFFCNEKKQWEKKFDELISDACITTDGYPVIKYLNTIIIWDKLTGTKLQYIECFADNIHNFPFNNIFCSFTDNSKYLYFIKTNNYPFENIIIQITGEIKSISKSNIFCLHSTLNNIIYIKKINYSIRD